MNKFHVLKVDRIREITSDAVEITFTVPTNLKDIFIFKAGQYITIKHIISGQEVRRSYSLCSSPLTGEISVGVKRIEGGMMSTFLTRDLKEGDEMNIMPPNGNFVLKGESVVGICAGSGITPILSMMKQQSSNFTLVYGNKFQDSAMFLEEIQKMSIPTYFVYSQEEVNQCYNGRIDNNILGEIAKGTSLLNADHYFICGPGKMIETTENFLLENGIDSSKIHFERFTSSPDEETEDVSLEDSEIMSNITVVIDGDEFEYQLSSKGESILDSAMEQGADVPFSCKGAVCCTCKAKVISGKARMDKNFSLTDEEVEEGYILTCQSHPTTEDIVVDFDEI